MKEIVYQIIEVFNDLTDTYDNQFSLYFDSQVWELFDLRTCRPILRESYKHSQSFLLQLQRLNHDFLAVLSVKALNTDKINHTEAWSMKRIINIYGYDPYFMSNKMIKKYEQRKQTEAMADCY